MRRNLLPAILAIALVPATVALVLRAMAEPPPSVLPFAKPTYRMAVAVESAMQAELTGVKQGKASCTQDFGELSWMDPSRVVPGTKPPTTPDKAQIPEDYAAFWMYIGNTSPPSLMVLDEMELTGKARDGREIKATIKGDPIGAGSVVDFGGDAEAAKQLGPKIAALLAHPRHAHESHEDRAALKVFFSSTQFTTNTSMQFMIPAPALGAPPVPIPITSNGMGGAPTAASSNPASPSDPSATRAGFPAKAGDNDPGSAAQGLAKPGRGSDGASLPGIDPIGEPR